MPQNPCSLRGGNIHCLYQLLGIQSQLKSSHVNKPQRNVVDSTFVFCVVEETTIEAACPLACAGTPIHFMTSVIDLFKKKIKQKETPITYSAAPCLKNAKWAKHHVGSFS